MYGKLIEGSLIAAPSMLPGDGVNVWNPPAAMYMAQGWKPVIFTDEPSDPPEGYAYEPGWGETSDEIVQTWTLVEEPDEVDPAEAWEIIFGGDGDDA